MITMMKRMMKMTTMKMITEEEVLEEETEAVIKIETAREDLVQVAEEILAVAPVEDPVLVRDQDPEETAGHHLETELQKEVLLP